jgi:phosphoserine phosphatase RsbU/P
MSMHSVQPIQPLLWVIDDSPLQREATRRSLAPQYEVVVFDSVAPMLERLSTGEHPDLLVLDWHLPDISGLEACHYIRQVADGAALPILVLTATGHHADMLAGLGAGANDFLKKPCDETELYARVASLVRTKRLHVRALTAESALRDEANFREKFLAILAHDLRQPLNVFGMGSDMLARAETSQQVREKVRGQFDRATARMQRMIGELLDFSRSRPQGGGMPVAPQAMDLAVLVRQVVDEVRLAHPQRDITVSVHGRCEGSWDADRLSQVVSNLIENALAHSTGDTSVKLAAESEWVEISVENQGEAIPALLLPTLFDPFRRGSTRPVSHRGLGLGLYIVDQIARAHGGTATVHSNDGLTRFTVRLPLAA